MTDLIEVKAADLVGEALGWAVGKAEGLDLYLEPPGYNGVPWRVFARYQGQAIEHTKRFNPWEDWVLGGPLIEKYKVSLSPPTSAVHRNFGYMDKRNGYYESGFWGSTIFGKDRKHRRTAFHHPGSPLIVAMRAIAQFELGDTVQVPKELMPYSEPNRSTTDCRLSGSSQVAADSPKEQLTTPSRSPLAVHFSASPPLPWLPLPQNSKPECE